MGYVILWLSSLAAALLFAAVVTALESLRKRHREQIAATVALARRFPSACPASGSARA